MADTQADTFQLEFPQVGKHISGEGNDTANYFSFLSYFPRPLTQDIYVRPDHLNYVYKGS
jgi:hypothetical protein